MNRRILRAALVTAWFGLGTTNAQGADGVLSLHAPPAAADLVCPNVVAAPVHPPETAEVSQMPPITALGDLARPVVRRPPVIDAATIPGFALREATGTRHIAVWGDSHVAAGAFMRAVSEALQSHGLTVVTRSLPPTMGRANVRLPALHAYCVGAAWTSELAYSARGRVQVGPALINRIADAGPESYLWLDLRSSDHRASVRELRIVYRAPWAARLAISVNDGPEQPVELGGGSDSQTLTVRADAPIGTLKLRVIQGRVVLHGFILDYARPAQVTFDVFGIPSATARGWANLDADYLTQTLQGEGYDAVVLEYGTNEGADVHFDRDSYAAGLDAALSTMRRVFPRASCVLVGPPDRGVLVKPGGGRLDLLSYARTVALIEATQARIGARFGCASWNWQSLMGGEGGSYGWALNAPPLMGRDLTHLTTQGYKLTGEALARSLGF